jgi:hypothetical protein
VPFRARFENWLYLFGPHSWESIVTVLRRAFTAATPLLHVLGEVAFAVGLTWLLSDRSDAE